MSVENDGIDDALEGQLRVLLTAATQAGEAIARAREEARRRAAHANQEEAHELATRLGAERDAARAQLTASTREEWWSGASPEQVSAMYQTARAWSAEDPALAAHEARLREELRRRYGVDVAHPGDLADAVAGAERLRQAAAQERAGSAKDRAEAIALTSIADAVDERARDEERPHADRDAADAERAAEPAYDSAERRAATAAELEEKGLTQEQVATRMRADVSQSEPATAAVRHGGPRKPAKAHMGRGGGQQVQRAGLSR